MKREVCQRGGMIHAGFSVSTFREPLDEFIHEPQIKSQIRGRRCKTKQAPRLFHSRDIAVCPESPPPRINTSWLARRLFIYPGDIFQRIFAQRLRFFCPLEWRCRRGGTCRVIPPRSLSRRKVLHLYQVSLPTAALDTVNILSTINQMGADGRRWSSAEDVASESDGREWLEPWILGRHGAALWCDVVGKHAANTLCRGSAIRGLFPTPSLSAWWIV